MKELFIIIRFPIFLIGLGIVIIYSIPLAILGLVLTPILLGIIWTWYFITSPIMLVWCALHNDKNAIKEHWANVENGLEISASYDSILSWFMEQYTNIYDWLIGN